MSLPVKAQECSSLNGNFGSKILTQNISKTTQSYKTTQDYLGNSIKLQMDVYQGVLSWNNSLLNQRPVVILFHGGGFKAGNRSTGAMRFFAEYFAQRGYVAISADYRLGWKDFDKTLLCGGGTTKDYLDAQYRAMQDERSLVKFLKSQASLIKFDTNRVFLFGISSGATLVCSRLEDEWITNDGNRADRLGLLEDMEMNNGFSSDVAGILSFAGANLSPDISIDFSTPIAFFHGTCDNAVPYEQQYLAGCNNLGYYYGPKILSLELERRNLCYRNYTYCGFGHDLAAIGDEQRTVPWAMDDVLKESIHFIQAVLCNQCTSLIKVSNEGVNVQPVAECNPIAFYEQCKPDDISGVEAISLSPHLFHHQKVAYIYSHFDQPVNLFLNIFNMNGAVVESIALQIPQGPYSSSVAIELLDEGVYLYQFVDGKKIYASGKIWKI
ncbi:MAG: alpha/beta hydrolase [Chitinophagales bacterium]|nr:alpha/beta hydrolase [Chitinophagales bacterium]MCZ2393587.1 alpha/beta hydrolase [Chitinophagales bacterium]